MKSRTVYLVATAFISILAMSCCSQEQVAQDPRADLMVVIDSFYTAIENANVEARIALFADSAMMMPNHWTMTQGKKAIATGIRNSDPWEFKLRDRQIVDMDVRGDIAYTVNSYYYTWHEKGAEPQWHKTKNVHIWKKDADGNWKLHVDIWNSDVPLDKFSEE